MKAASLDLNFAAYRETRWRWIGMSALLLGGLASFSMLQLKDRADHQLAIATQEQARLLRATGAKQKQTVTDDPKIAAEMKRADVVLDALTLPWESLFDMVEGAGAKGLALISLAPDPRSGSLRIAGEAKSVEEMLAYISRLSAQPMLNQVHLVSYETGQREGASVIQFTLVATWK